MPLSTPQARLALAVQDELDLSARSAAPGQIFLAVVLLWISQRSGWNWIPLLCCVTNISLGLLRTYLAFSGRRAVGLKQAVTILSGLGWGIALRHTVHWTDMGAIDTIIGILLAAGCASSAVTSLYPDLAVYVIFVSSVLLLPLTTMNFFVQDRYELAIPALFFGYYCFLLRQGQIHRRKLLEDLSNRIALKEQNEKLETVVDTSPGIVTIIDGQLRYQLASQTAHERARDHGGIIGREVGYASPGSPYEKTVREFMASGKAEDQRELLYDTPRGLRWNQIHMKRMEAFNGGAVLVSIDIHDAKNANAKNETAGRQMVLGEMAAGIAHEINNPLFIIQGNVERILRECGIPQPDPSRIAESGKRILTTVERIAQIVRTMRNLAHATGARPAAAAITPLRSIVEDALSMCSERIQNHGTTLEVREIPDLRVNAFPGELSQVLYNLLANARYAVEKTPAEAKKWIRLSFETAGDRVLVHVADSGPPIPPEIQARLMNPFFTTKPVGQGTGLGLSISRSIAERHGGALEYNRGAENTDFVLTLPIK